VFAAAAAVVGSRGMELELGWWGGYGERWQRGSMWLANQACLSFVVVAKAHVEGCSATICGIEVGLHIGSIVWSLAFTCLCNDKPAMELLPAVIEVKAPALSFF
jgi:hypothetical protein